MRQSTRLASGIPEQPLECICHCNPENRDNAPRRGRFSLRRTNSDGDVVSSILSGAGTGRRVRYRNHTNDTRSRPCDSIRPPRWRGWRPPPTMPSRPRSTQRSYARSHSRFKAPSTPNRRTIMRRSLILLMFGLRLQSRSAHTRGSDAALGLPAVHMIEDLFSAPVEGLAYESFKESRRHYYAVTRALAPTMAFWQKARRATRPRSAPRSSSRPR